MIWQEGVKAMSPIENNPHQCSQLKNMNNTNTYISIYSNIITQLFQVNKAWVIDKVYILVSLSIHVDFIWLTQNKCHFQDLKIT